MCSILCYRNQMTSPHRWCGAVISWWRHQMETFSALLAICAGNSPVPGEFPAQRRVTPSFDVFFDLRLNKRLSKQSRGWWFETLSRPLWRQCNVIEIRWRLLMVDAGPSSNFWQKSLKNETFPLYSQKYDVAKSHFGSSRCETTEHPMKYAHCIVVLCFGCNISYEIWFLHSFTGYRWFNATF